MCGGGARQGCPAGGGVPGMGCQARNVSWVPCGVLRGLGCFATTLIVCARITALFAVTVKAAVPVRVV